DAAPPAPPQSSAAYTSRQRWLFVVVAMTGFASLVLEVAWVRVFSMVFGSSAQAFTLMLTAFILGIALGSAVASALMKRQLDPARVLVGLLACSVLLLTLQLPFYERLAFWQFKVAQALERRAEIYPLYLASQCVMAFAWMLPATIATGAALPVAVLAFTRRVEETGASVGRLFAANTVGTVIGPLVASFLLLPWLGIQGAIQLSIFVLALAAVTVAWGVLPGESSANAGRRSRASHRIVRRVAIGAVLVSAATSLVPSWDANEMHAGGFRRWTLDEGASFEEFERTRHRSEVLFETDGITDSVIVVRNRAGHIFMKVNGKTDASDDADLPTQRMVAHIPLLLHRAWQLSAGQTDRPADGWFDTQTATASSMPPRPVPLLVEPPPERDVYIVGVGSGTTVGAASRHTNVQVTAYDISEGILEGSRFFSHINEAYYERENVHYGLGDARERLRRTPGLWDVIINQPSNPWIAGNAALFSHEFFELGRDRLDENGVFAQWMHVYAMDDASLNLVMNTFLDVFPYVTVWWPQEVDLVLIGSMEPLEFTESALATSMGELDMREEVAGYEREGVRLDSMERLLAIQVLSEAGVRDAFPGTPPYTTDLSPRLEFLAPVAQFVGQRTNRFVELDERQRPGERTRLWLGMRDRWDRSDLGPFLNERNTPFALRLAGSMTHATMPYPPSATDYAEYVQHATGLPVVFEAWTERMLDHTTRGAAEGDFDGAVGDATPSAVACREFIDTAIDALSGRATVFYRPPLDSVTTVIDRCGDMHPDQAIIFDALHAELLAGTGYSTEADRRIDALLALGLPEQVRDLLLDLRSEPVE
ncbi:MAG: spermidine synthase, partial [Bradymonadia bacterium]